MAAYDCRMRVLGLSHAQAGSVAQLDRALPSEGKGRAFESRRVRHKINELRGVFEYFSIETHQILTKSWKALACNLVRSERVKGVNTVFADLFGVKVRVEGSYC